MNGVHRRIVVLRDIHSNLIEEAILVLKTEPENESGSSKKTEGPNAARDKDFILKEAQSIINNYVEQLQQQESLDSASKKEEKSFKSQFITNLIINSALTGSILLLAFFVSKLL